jgi:hypothetical protein
MIPEAPRPPVHNPSDCWFHKILGRYPACRFRDAVTLAVIDDGYPVAGRGQVVLETGFLGLANITRKAKLQKKLPTISKPENIN